MENPVAQWIKNWMLGHAAHMLPMGLAFRVWLLVIQLLTTLIPGIPFFVPGVGAVVAAMGQLLINHRTGHRYM